jgi:hypothetical protein
MGKINQPADPNIKDAEKAKAEKINALQNSTANTISLRRITKAYVQIRKGSTARIKWITIDTGHKKSRRIKERKEGSEPAENRVPKTKPKAQQAII